MASAPDDASTSASAPAPAPASASASAHDADNFSLNAMSGYSIDLSVDTASDDNDSALGDEVQEAISSTRSATSSVYEFVEEFGRTYHRYKEGKYFLPNDEREQNRLDLQHDIAKRVLGGVLGYAPPNDPSPLDAASTAAAASGGAPATVSHRVLDLGTGTGIWAIDFAEAHPAADVLGTDLSPIQPEYVPANCRFEIDDADDEWAFSQPFDYIHGRYVVPFFRDTPRVIQQVFANLRPGGYFELFESPVLFQAVDDSLEGTALQAWHENITAGVRRMGRDPRVALQLRKLLADVGFVNIVEKRLALPINAWPRGHDMKLLGAMEMANLLDVVHGISMSVLTKGLGWSLEEVEVCLTGVRNDLRNRNIHAYLPVIAIYGQKPL